MAKEKEKKTKLADTSHVLLVGNGINDAQKISWNNMLNFVQDQLKLSEDERIIAGQTEVSPTLLFDFLCLRKNTNDVRSFVKEYISDKSNFVKKVWNMYDIVLTTNFDDNLYVNARIDDAHLQSKGELLERNSVHRMHIKFTYNSSQKFLYFLHGYYKNPETICLGLDQYFDNLRRIRDYALNSFFKGKSHKKVSWVDFFFTDNTTIDILGFSFCASEIDLWWILEKRKELRKEGKLKNNVIRYFDLKEGENEEFNKVLADKHRIFKAFDVDVEKIEGVKSYNSDFYSLCLKKMEI